MSISRLTHIIEHYDPYGMHRLNGIKVVYVFFVLSFVNLFFTIPGVYFYYFYIPITSMSAEVIAERIEDKFKAFMLTVLGSSIMVFIFSVLNAYPLFFLFGVFLSSLFLYFLALRYGNFFMPCVPIILSLAAYSLLYTDLNMNLHMTFNNTISTLFALFVVLIALLCFPLSYYYRLWLRAFLLLLEETLENLSENTNKTHPDSHLIRGHTRYLIVFSRMLPRRFPTFSILKINLLLNRLHLESCVRKNQSSVVKNQELSLLIEQIQGFMLAVKMEKPYVLDWTRVSTRRWVVLIKTWNHLCLKV